MPEISSPVAVVILSLTPGAGAVLFRMEDGVESCEPPSIVLKEDHFKLFTKNNSYLLSQDIISISDNFQASVKVAIQLHSSVPPSLDDGVVLHHHHHAVGTSLLPLQPTPGRRW